MHHHFKRRLARIWAAICILLIGVQVYAGLLTYGALRTDMPTNFGNFPRVRDALPTPEESKPFTFVVVGDTRSKGTFESLTESIGKVDPTFVVILGDWVNGGSPEEHALFRMEATKYDLDCPVLFTPGNHDVDPAGYPLERFEAEYGPRNFSFEYRNNLFIFISHLDSRFSNAESLAYLRSLQQPALEKYDNRFVFTHIPPWVSPDIKKRHTKDENELMQICEELNIDYFIAGDFHGYNRTLRDGVEYIVTGGGGAHLHETTGKQFHHAIALTIDNHMVSEKIIPQAANFEIENWLKYSAVVYVGPFIFKHLVELLVINLLVLAGTWAVLRRKMLKPSACPSHAAFDTLA